MKFLQYIASALLLVSLSANPADAQIRLFQGKKQKMLERENSILSRSSLNGTKTISTSGTVSVTN